MSKEVGEQWIRAALAVERAIGEQSLREPELIRTISKTADAWVLKGEAAGASAREVIDRQTMKQTPRLGSDFVRPPPAPVVVQPVPPAPAAGPVRRRIVEPAPLLPRGKIGPVVRPVPPREYRPTEREREQARARAEAEKALTAERERKESPAPAVDGGGDEVTAAE